MNETHIEHAISFIEHQDLNLAQVQRTLTVQVEQAAGGRYQHIHTLPQPADLRIDLDPTENHQ